MTEPTVLVAVSATTLDQLLRSRLTENESLDSVIRRLGRGRSGEWCRSANVVAKKSRINQGWKYVSRRHYVHTILGETVSAPTLADVLVGLLAVLCDLDGDLLERLSQVPAGRSRRIVARSPDSVYPGSPHLRRYTRRLKQGWWVGTHYSQQDIRRIVRKICESCGLRYGEDVTLQF